MQKEDADVLVRQPMLYSRSFWSQILNDIIPNAKVSLWRRDNYGSATLNAVSFTLTPESVGDRDNFPTSRIDHRDVAGGIEILTA